MRQCFCREALTGGTWQEKNTFVYFFGTQNVGWAKDDQALPFFDHFHLVPPPSPPRPCLLLPLIFSPLLPFNLPTPSCGARADLRYVNPYEALHTHAHTHITCRHLNNAHEEEDTCVYEEEDTCV